MNDLQNNNREQWIDKHFFRASAEDFKRIPGSPTAYWVSKTIFEAFLKFPPLGQIASPKIGMRTGNNERFLRKWYEIEECRFQNPNFMTDTRKWVPYNKGGEFRRWYGNLEFVVNWENDGYEIKEATLRAYPQLSWDNLGWKISNEGFYFKKGVTWTDLSSSCFGVRILPSGFIFDAAGPAIFGELPELYLAQMGSKVSFEILKILNPTLHFKNYNIAALPSPPKNEIFEAQSLVTSLCELSKADWDTYENSWDYTCNPLLHPVHHHYTLKASYQQLSTHWREMTLEMQRLEEENNRIFINAYGLQDELTPEVPLNEITLTCNPHYRYGGDKTEVELEALLLADTMREFISYAMGCMFGRYALDKPGLVLANQGETIEDYRRLVPNSRFEADADNVIPMLDGEWFADDVTERFRQFLRVTFGDDHYDENLAFIEQALNPKGKRNYTLREYMLGEFYTDHVKRYKKRPIYWLFSSGNGKSGGTFNALVYMHRYRPDTASVVLRYLREFRAKLASRQSTLEQVLINPATSQGEKTKAVKEIDSLKKQIIELQDYENDTLYPLATAQVAIDLDDGVKVNYLKLGAALKKITGLDAKEED